jgi:hypothetical protein
MTDDDRLLDNAAAGVRALHYVQNEIRHLSAIDLTPEGKHARLVFSLMLREVWGKEYRDGAFVFLDGPPP